MMKRGNTYVPYLEHKAREDIQNDHELITLLKEEYDDLCEARIELRKVAWSRGREMANEAKFVLPVNFSRECSKRRERASRNGSTVVKISMTPLSFKPVPLSLSRSPLL